ncbi:MAG: hypothetical protein AB7G10_05390 [Reyranellaceae bacterium]
MPRQSGDTIIPVAPLPSTGLPADGVIRTRAEAYNRLEQQGYRDIEGLALGTDGNWHAQALRGAVAVDVMVGPYGRISAN